MDLPLRRSRLALWLDLIRWDRPAGWLLLLWPTLSALWIAAGGFPGWHLLLVFVAGTILMRSAGCAANDVADREFDRHVKRTAARPVTSGAVPPWEALTLGAALALVAFALVLTTNAAAVAWSVRRPRGDPLLSVQQALLRDAAGRARHRLQLRHPDGVRGGARRRGALVRRHARRGAAARLVAAARQPVLGARLRHRVRHGRSRRRPAHRHQDLGDHARPLRRARRHDLLCPLPDDLGGDRRLAGPRCRLLRRPLRRDGDRRLALHADPRPHARRVLSRLPPQPLARLRRLRRRRPDFALR